MELFFASKIHSKNKILDLLIDDLWPRKLILKLKNQNTTLIFYQYIIAFIHNIITIN